MTYMILDKISTMDVPHPGIQVNGFYEKNIIVGWAIFNRHHIVLVIVFFSKPTLNPHHEKYPQLWKLRLMMNSLLAPMIQFTQNHLHENFTTGCC